MKVTAGASSGFVDPPVGTHVSICVKIIDIGTQQGEWQGKPTSRRQVIIGWELPFELMEEGEKAGMPFTVNRWYTFSIGDKANLRHDLVNWRTRDFTPEELEGFELSGILGKPGTVTISENEQGRRRVTGVGALPRGTKVPKQVNPSVMLSLEPDEFDRQVFEGLSDKLREMIVGTPEYKACVNGAGPGDDDFDDGPPLDDSDFPPF